MAITEDTHGVRPDRIRRLLLLGTFLSVGGRGTFLALGAVYFTQVVGLGARDFGVAVSAAGAAGVLAGYGFGHAADRVSPRRLAVAGITIEAGSLMAVPVVTDLWILTILISTASFGSRGAVSARNTYVAHVFHGADGTHIRAQTRVAVNLGVGLATLTAAATLALGEPEALQVTMAIGSTTTLAGAVLTYRLPRLRRVRREPQQRGATTPSPWRDRTFLSLTGVNVIAGTQISLFQVGLPLWILDDTEAPAVLVSITLLINTLLIVALQVPLTRGLESMPRAGLAYLASGNLLVLACACYYSASLCAPQSAVVLLVTGVVAHTVAEVWAVGAAQSAAFELAVPGQAGVHQGAYVAAQSTSSMIGPVLVTVAVTAGVAGWSIPTTLLCGACILGWRVLRTATETHPTTTKPAPAVGI